MPTAPAPTTPAASSIHTDPVTAAAPANMLWAKCPPSQGTASAMPLSASISSALRAKAAR